MGHPTFCRKSFGNSVFSRLVPFGVWEKEEKKMGSLLTITSIFRAYYLCLIFSAAKQCIYKSNDS